MRPIVAIRKSKHWEGNSDGWVNHRLRIIGITSKGVHYAKTAVITLIRPVRASYINNSMRVHPYNAFQTVFTVYSSYKNCKR